MRITPDDLEDAVSRLEMLRFFPSGSGARAAIMRELAKMCPHLEALKWTIDQVVAHVSDWPGIAEVRGILCNKYYPADGKDQWSTLAGFTAADGEQKYLERHEELKRLEQGENRGWDMLKLPAGKIKTLQ